MNVHSALQAGKQGILFTVFSISGTLLFGYLMGRWLNIDKKQAVSFRQVRQYVAGAR